MPVVRGFFEGPKRHRIVARTLLYLFLKESAPKKIIRGRGYSFEWVRAFNAYLKLPHMDIRALRPKFGNFKYILLPITNIGNFNSFGAFDCKGVKKRYAR
jgi:hypothetical protein